VIVVDANLLIYSYDSALPRHESARTWLEKTFSGAEPVILTWQSIGAFARIISNRRVPGERFSIQEVVDIVDGWLDQPNVHALGPGEQHWPLFRKMLVEGQASGDLTNDAQLAALTMECGGVLYTTDRDFARFPGLRWTNPLAP
jgi:toxin-antitoxin system PIN domain toxin